jgi:hypothetical protein
MFQSGEQRSPLNRRSLFTQGSAYLGSVLGFVLHQVVEDVRR